MTVAKAKEHAKKGPIIRGEVTIISCGSVTTVQVKNNSQGMISCYPAQENLFLDLKLQAGEVVWTQGVFFGEVSSCLGIEVNFVEHMA